MWGVAFEVEARLNVRAGEAVQLAEDVYLPFSGQVTSTAKDAFRRCAEHHHQSRGSSTIPPARSGNDTSFCGGWGRPHHDDAIIDLPLTDS